MPRSKKKACKRKRQATRSKKSSKSLKDGCKEIELPVKVSTSNYSYNFGNIAITLHGTYTVPNAFTLLFNLEDQNCCIYWQGKPKNLKQIISATYEIPVDVLQSLYEAKSFIFILNSHVLHSGKNIIQIYLNPSSCFILERADEPYFNHKRKMMLRLLEFFLNVEFDEYEEKSLHDEEQIEKIYSAICNCYDPKSLDFSVSHDCLIPRLRLYQSQAVRWMLERENPVNNHTADLHVLYTTLKTHDGQELYFHKYGGFFVNQKFAPEDPCKGGILADEMGLGKTLEVLACILLNPRKDLQTSDEQPIDLTMDSDETIEHCSDNTKTFECFCGCLDSLEFIDKPSVSCGKCGVVHHTECVLYRPELLSDDYTCPYCWINSSDFLLSRATLIISPASIIHQWEEEILRHIKKDYLKVFMYKGVEHQKFIEPSYLADHDIVITSYETLRKELKYVGLPHGKNNHSLRHPKKFMAIPSPMCAIEWWRICLDEAQMVESVSSKISQMTGKLHCINRWCVTGTPIKKSIEDLYGLLLFLEAKPYQEKLWWKEVIWKPFANGDMSNISSVLKEMAWRTTKQQVLDQIQIPELQEVIHKLNFMPLERLHYEKKHALCKGKFMEKIEIFDSLDIDLNSVDKRVLSKVMLPLRHLQLACCVYKVQKGSHSITMTPEELLDHMLKTAKYECEDAHRKWIMAMNGLAGIYNLQDKLQEAVETYEQVLASIEKNEKDFRTDVTQRIHSLFHLSKLLSISENKGQNVGSKFTSEELKAKVSELSIEYMRKGKDLVVRNRKPARKIAAEIASLKKTFVGHTTSTLLLSGYNTLWWAVMFDAQSLSFKESFLSSLHDCLLRRAPGITLLKQGTERVSDATMRDFTTKVYGMFMDLHSARHNVRECMGYIASEPSQSIMDSAISCHLRPVPKSEKCLYCKADDYFKLYETKLFHFDETADVIEEPSEENSCFSALRRGTHADGDLEIVVKHFSNFFRRMETRTVEYPPTCDEDCATELELLELLKKEFKYLRNLWLKCSEYIAQKDELEMAKISARLILPQEKPQNPPLPYVLKPDELLPKMKQYEVDISSHKCDLGKKMHHLVFLQNLEMAKNESTPFQELCPICQQTIRISWSVLACGHNFCLVCMDTLLKTRSEDINATRISRGMRCPVCRHFNAASDIYYIGKGKTEDLKQVKGSHSTKTSAVVKCLLDIKKSDSTAKSLVFSSFVDFLYSLEDALEQNDIKCFNFCKKKYFQALLKEFKERNEYNVLLIPLSFGCSGLNITQATNVLLAEPVLDDSKHLQAIGRMHRIGQTKKTTVHRFLISSTIEENIYNVTKISVNDNSMCRKLTLKNITDIFQEC